MNTRRNDGGSAFPILDRDWDSDRGCFDYSMAGGMTLRDYFAAKALVGMLAEPIGSGFQSTAQYLTETEPGDAYTKGARMARAAYAMADAMLAARKA